MEVSGGGNEPLRSLTPGFQIWSKLYTPVTFSYLQTLKKIIPFMKSGVESCFFFHFSKRKYLFFIFFASCSIIMDLLACGGQFPFSFLSLSSVAPFVLSSASPLDSSSYFPFSISPKPSLSLGLSLLSNFFDSFFFLPFFSHFPLLHSFISQFIFFLARLLVFVPFVVFFLQRVPVLLVR